MTFKEYSQTITHITLFVKLFSISGSQLGFVVIKTIFFKDTKSETVSTLNRLILFISSSQECLQQFLESFAFHQNNICARRSICFHRFCEINCWYKASIKRFNFCGLSTMPCCTSQATKMTPITRLQETKKDDALFGKMLMASLLYQNGFSEDRKS